MPSHGPMACPIDGSPLTMSERSGIEIDYCPICRGVWLDRGELDKIIERAAGDAARAVPPTAAPAPQSPPPPGYGQGGYAQPSYGQPAYGHDPYRHGGHHGHKRRKSFLEEIFD